MDTITVVAVICLLAGSSIKANTVPKKINPSPEQHSLSGGPTNTAIEQSGTVILLCSGTPGSGYRITWTEYAYSTSGEQISDNEILLNHPQKARYAILQPTVDTFNLQISSLVMADGGTYICEDINGYSPQFYKWAAELIILEGQPNCTTTIPASGQLLEGDKHTIECLVFYKGNISPYMTVTGPPPYLENTVTATTSVWVGAEFIVNRTMEGGLFEIKTNFTNNFYPVPPDSSSAIPAWSSTYQSSLLIINWKPTNMYAVPIKQYYEIGDIITCYADARPTATYTWQNMRTNEYEFGQGYIITEDLDGTEQSMRCEAQNTIYGTQYTENFFINVTVPARTTTPPTTTTPTTTPIPPTADCYDLTGVWLATIPSAFKVCFNVDRTSSGLVRGYVKNGTDTYMTEVFGKIKLDSNMVVGYSGITPLSDAISYVGECHRCYGVETLLVKDISRVVGSSCGSTKATAISQEFTFGRSSFSFNDCLTS